MLISLVSDKGGVGKTTTAIHLSYFLQQEVGTTVLVDSDPNRSALEWCERGGESIPFGYYTDKNCHTHLRRYDHIVIDSPARPNNEEFREIIEGSDFLLIPCPPRAVDMATLFGSTLPRMVELGVPTDKYAVLLTMVPTNINSAAEEEARTELKEGNFPVLSVGIRAYTAFDSAGLRGITVDKVAGNNRAKFAWRDYKEAFSELLSITKLNKIEKVGAA